MKNTSRLIVSLLTITAVSCLIATQVWAAPKLVVEDEAANPIFTVDDGGNVGFNISPNYAADVVSPGSASKSQLHFSLTGSDTGGGYLTSVNDNNFWISSGAVFDSAAGGWIQKSNDGLSVFFGSGSAGFRAYLQQGNTPGQVMTNIKQVMLIDYSGNMSIDGKLGIGTTAPTHLIHLAGGAYSDGATWVNASSRALKKDIKEVTAEEAIQTVENLKPVSFVYKEGDQDMHVGFIAEDVPEIVATSDRKGLESMDIAAVLTKVVQEQQRMLKAQQETMQQLQDKIVSLENALQFKKDKDPNLAQKVDGIHSNY
jgi:hypothetical protein